jgi:3',5'-cyclic AMP phosphodiesterase CpdA
MNVDQINAFEDGSQSEEETVEMFQAMIDDGSVWGLQGFYGRTAMDLIRSGQCHLAKERQKDYYGNVIPSQADVDSGLVTIRR